MSMAMLKICGIIRQWMIEDKRTIIMQKDIGLQSSSPRKLFQIMISGINLEIINYFKIVIVEKLITINKINLHQQSSSDLA